MSDDRSRFGAGGDRIDRAIDRAVRTMMHVDPRVGLRRRVLARLDSPEPRSVWWESRTVRLALAPAAMVTIVAALAMLLRQPQESPAMPPAEPATATARPQPVPAAEPAVRQAATITASGPEAPAPKPPSTRMAPANLFGPPNGRVRGATIAPVASDPLRSADPSVEDAPRADAAESGLLKIAPLDVRPLQIAPIGPPR